MQAANVQDAADRIAEVVSDLESEIAEALVDLIRVPSVNPNYPGCRYEELVGGEGEANAHLARVYARAGCDVQRVEVQKGRANLVGVLRGTDPARARSLIFNGHVDEVPPGDGREWTGGDPFSGRREGSRIYGRGACDQKGGLVAQAMAAVALGRADIRLRGDLLLESVVGEEVGEHDVGVQAVIDAGYRADAAIVSEPTAPPVPLAIAPVSAGLLWMTISVKGKTGHNNLRPEMVRAGGLGDKAAVNAVEKAIYLVNRLQDLEQQWGQKYTHPLFKPGHFTLHPGVIIGGPGTILVPFMVADHCTVEYSILYPPEPGSAAIKAEIEDYVLKACQLDPWLRDNPPTLTWRLDWEPSVLDPNHPICQTLAEAHQAATNDDATIVGHGAEPRIRAFCAVCDATYLNKSGVPAVAYGPGSLLTAHAVDEYVELPEVLLATRAFALTAIKWCGITS